MNRSTARILTTHSGSLIRTREIIEGMKALTIGAPYDRAQLAADIRHGIADVVQKQVAIGIDIPNDGEYGRRGFTNYMHERLSGLQPRPIDAADLVVGQQTERAEFPGFYEQYEKHFNNLWMLPEVSMAGVPAFGGSQTELFRLVGPISYTGQAAVQRDLDVLKSALQGQTVADAFLSAVTPVSRKGDRDILNYYPSEEAYLYALADAMRDDYKAITDAGIILQLDYAALNPHEQILKGRPALTSDELRRGRERSVEIVNHALQGIPEDRVRYHHCWGSSNRPRTHDQPLSEILPQMLKLNIQAYGVEAANPRHEHEWMVWQDVKLPEGKILIPGIISQSTNVVEHPELVAWRIRNFASVVGKENVIAGTDCGFSSSWNTIKVHPTVQWAKLEALVEGAALASQQLWG